MLLEIRKSGERATAPRTCTFLPPRESTVKEPVCSDILAAIFPALALLPDKSRAIGIVMPVKMKKRCSRESRREFEEGGGREQHPALHDVV